MTILEHFLRKLVLKIATMYIVCDKLINKYQMYYYNNIKSQSPIYYDSFLN